MHSRLRLPVLSLLLAAGIAACGGGTEGVAVVASAPGTIGVGDQRMIAALLTEQGEFVNEPDLDVRAELWFGGEMVEEVDTEFVWAIENVRGFYAIDTTFDRAGTWEIVLAPDGRGPTPPTPFPVVEDPGIPDVGDPAPPSVTKTLADHTIDEITTDPDPEPSFYRLTVSEAVGDGRPSVIVFATPAFCTSATCGPTLDRVESIAPDHPDVDFVHVEIYDNLDAADFNSLETVPAVEEWRLPSEPWVFVVGSDGIITARFEGTVGVDELTAALARTS